ncbi:MAG: hypothetical protein ACHQIM_22160 [Sphingobacteriales bacterium]
MGWLIAYFGFHQNGKTSLGSYQLRQTLLLHIVFMVVRYGLAFVLGAVWLSAGFFSLYYLLWIIQIVFFVLWIIGFIGAINGEQKPIPFFGAWAQTMFPTI